MNIEFLIQQMKLRLAFGSSLFFQDDFCLEKIIWSPFSSWLRMKYCQNKDINHVNWFYITGNAWYAPQVTGLNFGSSDSIGSLQGQSEMTLNRTSSDPNNAV